MNVWLLLEINASSKLGIKSYNGNIAMTFNYECNIHRFNQFKVIDDINDSASVNLRLCLILSKENVFTVALVHCEYYNAR